VVFSFSLVLQEKQRADERTRTADLLITSALLAIWVRPKGFQLAGADHTVFVSGDEAEAEATVTELFRSFGWTDIIDLGDTSAPRGVPRCCCPSG
jgi:hypothetical protein